MIHNAAAFSDELLMEWLEYLGWFVIYIDRVYEYIEITGAIRIYSSTPPQKITQSSLQVGRTQQHYVLSMIHNAAAFSDELLMEWLEYLGWFVIYIDRVYEYIEITGAIRIYSSTPPQKITQSSLQVGRTQQHYVLSMIHNAAAFSDELLMEWLEYLGWFVIYIDRVYEYIEITGAIRIYSSTPSRK